MASTFYKHYGRLLQARGSEHAPHYKTTRQAATKSSLETRVDRIEALFDQLTPAERKQIEARLVASEVERKHQEHLDHYTAMNAEANNAFRTQIQAARTQPGAGRW